MEVKLNIGYEQLMDIIHQLPTEEINKLKVEIEKMLAESKASPISDLESLLLQGPVMSDEQFHAFEENRKAFDQWRVS